MLSAKYWVSGEARERSPLIEADQSARESGQHSVAVLTRSAAAISRTAEMRFYTIYLPLLAAITLGLMACAWALAIVNRAG